MNVDTSIGLDDEARARKAREDSENVDLTREEIEAGNDHNVSADQGNRSGRTNKLPDDGIEIGAD